jgi:flagellar protein FliO/FliZ
MESVDFSRLFLALAFVIFLIWLCAFIVQRTGLDRRLRGTTGSKGRLQVLEVLYLDPKRRVILMRADTSEYLVLLAGDAATLLDTKRVS